MSSNLAAKYNISTNYPQFLFTTQTLTTFSSFFILLRIRIGFWVMTFVAWVERFFEEAVANFFSCLGLACLVLSWIGLDWIGLDWTGLDWICLLGTL